MSAQLLDNVLTELAAQIDTPILSGLQVQGDLLIVPAEGKVSDATTPIPTQGVPLVRGAGGHVHLLIGKGFYTPGRDGAQTIGTITVPAGEVAYLAHGDGTVPSALSADADHALLAVGAGTYVVRRQREQSDVVRMVAD